MLAIVQPAAAGRCSCVFRRFGYYLVGRYCLGQSSDLRYSDRNAARLNRHYLFLSSIYNFLNKLQLILHVRITHQSLLALLIM